MPWNAGSALVPIFSQMVRKRTDVFGDLATSALILFRPSCRVRSEDFGTFDSLVEIFGMRILSVVWLAWGRKARVVWQSMSATEILEQLPHLSRAERRAIARRVFELDDDRDELQWAAEAADLAFQELDKLEEESGPSATR